ncbi:hypothetical protein OF122_00320 [Pelagibacterium flavum]|uniref:Uncharacterized protein n=1 Tax=Pelagibacterium flavum TaxID=2984530 RepID=A0ABY6IRD2_9HYPH|nr:hypothetical protein [Pelagibacterium sp. YIM 151497]UYQ72275.1 hypothetical protein OF122_00320 [Pelagibacterium sp. YIM 151497]
MRQLAPALIYSAVSVLLVAAFMLAPQSKGEMAVAFSPFTSEETAWSIVRAAGGYAVGPTRIPNIVVAYADDSDFQQRARSLGALFFLKASGLCAPQTNRETT